jgi:hypothetical protein
MNLHQPRPRSPSRSSRSTSRSTARVTRAVLRGSNVRMMSAGPDLADWLRWGGLGFELTGLGITAAGIADLRRRYSDRPGVVGAVGAALRRTWSRIGTAAGTAREAGGRVWQWLRRAGRERWNQALNVTRRLRGRRQVDHGRATVAVAGVVESDADAYGTGTVTRGNADQRLDGLEQRTEEIKRSIARLEGDVDDRIRDLASGGLRAETVGVAVLALGLILSSISAGLADLIRNVFGL